MPGVRPHPKGDQAERVRCEAEVAPSPLRPERWQECAAYLYAIDLFNHGYYWEAHEAWESVWIACGRRGRAADWLKGLIKLTAAAVKLREGNPVGVRRHAMRSIELIRAVCPDAGAFAGIESKAVLDCLGTLAAVDTVVADPHKLLPLILRAEQEPG